MALTRRKGFLAAIVMALVLVAGLPLAAYAALQVNFKWYTDHEAGTAYIITSAGQLKGLAELVNGTADIDGDGEVDAGPVDFAGETIRIESLGPLNYLGEAIVPIGAKEHPFQGTFDGNGMQVDNFNLSIPASDAKASVQYVGLFGYVGEKGSISNLSIGARSAITIERGVSSKQYIANVGMVAGYCGGSIVNCENRGTVTIKSAVAQQSKDDFIPVRNVGGVVGQCVYDVTGCRNSGSVNVAETSSPVVDINHAQLVARVGGVVGLLGDESRIGTYDKHIYGEADKHGAVSDCANTAKITVDTPELAGLDRFGQQTNAESLAVGGVVGYSQGSVRNCTNGIAQGGLGQDVKDAGYICAGNGGQVGGVVGSLRGVLADNTRIAYADDGADGKDPLEVVGCVNYGDVYARVTAGGVVGKSSSYTTITQCANSTKRATTDALGSTQEVATYVVANRWNKPGPGGIVGTANGVVSYCSNTATVASAEWSSETDRTLKVKDGYYVAGIVGMLVYFGDDAPKHGGVETPVSECFSCYNGGGIVAGANMRQRGITGQNDGYTHDNVLVKGLVYNDDIVYGSKPEDSEASGTVGENRVYSEADLQGGKAAEAVAFLNANSTANGWESYWMISPEGGYPVLNTTDAWKEKTTSIVDAHVEFVKNAPYTGGDTAPEVKVELNGAQLVLNADYRVVPQAGAVEPTAGSSRPYKAQIVGIGKYSGTASTQVGYGIGMSDLAQCSVTAIAHTFDYEAHVPSASDVTVRTPAGTVVDPSEYTFELVDKAGKPIKAVDADMYTLKVTANAASAHYTGSLLGEFRIKPASFMRDVELKDVKIRYLGKEYPWVDSKEVGEADNPSTTLPYTGVAVEPEVGAIVYKGHTLVTGKDYRIVYGNRNSDDGYTGDYPENNVGKKGGTTAGCVTIRYINGGGTNFSSYANMFYLITDMGTSTDLAKATWKVDGEQFSDGNPLTPVQIYLGAAKLQEGTDYTIEYQDNVEPGTATFTATGIGLFTGTLSGSFDIAEGTLVDIHYEFAGDGSAGAPYEATVTGAEYSGSRDAFELRIPSMVEHDGREYAVVAIGARAFGGGLKDFEGSAANESKRKLVGITLPASVRSIGDYAFGTASTSMVPHPPLAKIEFAEGSELQEIGDYAFGQCKELASLTLPAGIARIGKAAFASCESLKELRFMTQDARLPSAIAEGKTSSTGAFYACSNVVVRGFSSAQAVKALAEANAGDSNGANGGRGFRFEPYASLADAQVADIPAQTYDGAAVEPEVVVSLNGNTLAAGTDFTVAYRDNVDAGTATAVVRGIGLYEGQLEKEFTIQPLPMRRVEIAAIGDVPFTGDAVGLSADVSYKGKRLAWGVDYTLSYADADGKAVAAPSQVGTYRLVATGIGNLCETNYRTFRIVAASLADASIDNIGTQEYTGSAITPDPVVRLAGAVLDRDEDYTVSYRDNREVGTATVTVHGLDGFTGSTSATFRIGRASLKNAKVAGVSDVQAAQDPETLEPVAVAFEPTVVVSGRKLVAGQDFEVSYADEKGQVLDAPPAEVGSYQLVASGMGNYEGSASVAFAITADVVDGKTDIAGAGVAFADAPDDAPEGAAFELPYTGAIQKPQVKVVLGDDELLADEDFTISYDNNRQISTGDDPADGGWASATVYGTGKYTGQRVAYFKIVEATITDADVKVAAQVVYTGSPVEPKVAVKVGGRSLVEGTDYELSYAGNTQVGAATVTVTGIGGFGGQVVREFAIVEPPASPETPDTPDTPDKPDAPEPEPDKPAVDKPQPSSSSSAAPEKKSIAKAAVSGLSAKTYTGKKQTPAPTVKLSGKTLKKGTDYAVSYANNLKAGTAKVTITGKGNYTGSLTKTFTIKQASIAKAKFSKVKAQKLKKKGKAVKPKVTVKFNGKALKAGVDYTVTYKNNKKKGTAKMVVKGKGNFSGSKTIKFKIK